jgi:hypothetical protein
VIQFRRVSALLLGAWLGASILTDIAVTQNFQTVDRFLQTPGNAGHAGERAILRRNAGEENNWIFLNWERVEFAIGGVLFLLLLFGDEPRKVMLTLSLVLLAIVAVEHFLLTPWITDLGRIVDNLSATDPQYKQFWMLHGFYSGLDIAKMLAGFVLAARMVIARKPDREAFAHEYASSGKEQGKVTRG